MARSLSYILVFAFLTIFASAQEADYILSKFFATQVEEEVLVRWTIRAGNTCEDTYVERSEDGVNYERIGIIGGICGSPDNPITYEFYDTIPLVNRESYYRLQLGQYGYTSPEVVEFNTFNAEGFLLAPNPFSDHTRLIIENGKGEEYFMVISDESGRVIHEQTTTDGIFIIYRNNIGAGTLFFRVLKEGKVLYFGKLIVL